MFIQIRYYDLDIMKHLNNETEMDTKHSLYYRCNFHFISHS